MNSSAPPVLASGAELSRPAALNDTGGEGWRCTPDAPYLMVTHIPFSWRDDGVVVDTLWAKDLRELAARLGYVRVAAPCMTADHPDFLWGTGKSLILPGEPFQFVALPDLKQEPISAIFGFLSKLKEAAKGCRVVHTSNVFGRFLTISWFHRWCVKQGLPTVYVVPEDFSDMLRWEWARVPSLWLRLKRLATVRLLEFAARETAATADLTLCFGGSALGMLRPTAKNPVVIHHALQEIEDCINDAELAEKQARILRGEPLQLVIAAHHHGLKGIDRALHVVALLKARGVAVVLRVYGQGPETANYQRLSEQLELGDQVFFRSGRTRTGAIPSATHRRFGADAAPHQRFRACGVRCAGLGYAGGGVCHGNRQGGAARPDRRGAGGARPCRLRG